jgi:hypothetical protein
VPSYPIAVSRDSIFVRSALFFDSFSPTGPLVKSIAGVLVVVPLVDVVDVLFVPVDAVVVVVVSVFLDFADSASILADFASTFANLASAFTTVVVVVGFVDGPLTSFADGAFDGPCVVVEGP